MPCWPQLIAFSVSSRGTYCSVFNISRSEPSFLRRDRQSWRRICGCYAASPAICKVTVGGSRHFIIITIKSYYLCPYSDLESLLLGSCSRSYLMTFNCFDLFRTLLVAFHSQRSPQGPIGYRQRWRSRRMLLNEAYFVVGFNEIFRISFNCSVLILQLVDWFLFNSTYNFDSLGS